MSNNSITVPVSQIKETFFVREGLTDDRVLYFAELYEANAVVDPITLIEGTTEVFDGRHRLAALKFIDRKDAVCVTIPNGSKSELIMKAFAANLGGPLPPNHGDIHHTIRLLLEEKVPRGEIIQQLTKMTRMPAEVYVKYLDKVQSNIAHAKVNRAIDSLTSRGLTVEQAALEHDVNVETLKNAISGKKGKKDKSALHHIKSEFSTRMRALSSKLGKESKKVLGHYRDGLRNEEEVDDFFSHMEHILKNLQASAEDWRKRYAAMRSASQAGDHLGVDTELNRPSIASKKKSIGEKALERMALS